MKNKRIQGIFELYVGILILSWAIPQLMPAQTYDWSPDISPLQPTIKKIQYSQDQGHVDKDGVPPFCPTTDTPLRVCPEFLNKTTEGYVPYRAKEYCAGVPHVPKPGYSYNATWNTLNDNWKVLFDHAQNGLFLDYISNHQMTCPYQYGVTPFFCPENDGQTEMGVPGFGSQICPKWDLDLISDWTIHRIQEWCKGMPHTIPLGYRYGGTWLNLSPEWQALMERRAQMYWDKTFTPDKAPNYAQWGCYPR